MGDIHNYINQYCNWSYDFDEYIRDREENKLAQFPIIKTFNGR
jgi:SUMO ligase MMS21 Smc5/6 complex component